MFSCWTSQQGAKISRFRRPLLHLGEVQHHQGLSELRQNRASADLDISVIVFPAKSHVECVCKTCTAGSHCAPSYSLAQIPPVWHSWFIRSTTDRLHLQGCIRKQKGLWWQRHSLELCCPAETSLKTSNHFPLPQYSCTGSHHVAKHFPHGIQRGNVPCVREITIGVAHSLVCSCW